MRSSLSRRVLVRVGLGVVVGSLLWGVCLAAAAAPAPAAAALPPGVDLQRPLSLTDAVRIALLNSPSLPIARQQWLQANASLTQSRATALPSLDLSADGAVTKSVVASGVDSTRTTRQLQLVLSHTFYQSGRGEQIQAARATAESFQFGETDTRRLLILAVAQDYYAAQAARAYVDVSRRSVVSSRQHLAMTDARFEQGMAARADRYPFETELAQAQVEVISAENLAETTLNALKLTLGLAADGPLLLMEGNSRLALPEKAPALLQAALEARPDVRERQAVLEAARQKVRVAHLQRGPVLNAGGDVGLGYFTGETGTFWQLQVGADLPLFDGGSTKAAEDSARAAQAIAEQNLRQTELDISNQVETYHRTATLAEARIVAADAAVRSADTSLKAAQAKYNGNIGLATPVDVTDAEVRLRTAEANSVQAVYDYNTAAAALLAALGQDAVPGVSVPAAP
jgi:OMF family outer membrane factor